MRTFVIILFFLVSGNLCAQVKAKSVFALFTIDEALELERAENEEILFEKRIYYMKNHAQAGFLNNNDTEEKIYIVMDSLRKVAAPVAFFSFFEGDKLNFQTIYFYIPDSDTFISLENTKVKGIKNLIAHEYGSVKKYQELLSERRTYSLFMNQSDDDLEGFVKTDYVISQQIMPEDTARTISLLIADIHETVNLTNGERQLLGRKIRELLNEAHTVKCPSRFSIQINAIEVSSALSETLDNERFFRYLGHVEFREKIRLRIMDKLYYRYDKEKVADQTFYQYLKTIVL